MKTGWLMLLVLTLASCGGGGPNVAEQRAALESVASGAVLIDVRSPEEVESGMLDRAVNIPHDNILAGVAELSVDKKAPIVLYCRSGNRSGMATEALRSAGFTNVVNAGGYEALRGLATPPAQG